MTEPVVTPVEPDPRPPEPEAFPTAVPPLSAVEFEARIARRRREMETQPCYRCGHSPASPDSECPCCRSAHTPDSDGNFPEAA